MAKSIVKLVISAIVGFIIIVVGMFAEVTFLPIVGLFWIFISFALFTIKSQEKNATYDNKTKTLYLHTRSKISESYIEIRQYEHASLKYNPEKVVYTGATVGGITTGGFHTEKAHYSVDSLKKTDFYELYYYSPIDKSDCGLIEKIVCDFFVNNSPLIKEFKIDEKTIIPKHTDREAVYTDVEKEVIKLAQEQNNKTVLQLNALKVATAKLLTLNEAKQLKAWIGGKNDE